MRRLIAAGVLGLLIALSAIPTLASTRPGCQVPNPHTSIPARCPQ